MKQNRANYESLCNQVLQASEKALLDSGKSREEVSASLDSEQSDYFAMISQADNVLWEIEALQEEYTEQVRVQEASKLKDEEQARKQQLEDVELAHKRHS